MFLGISAFLPGCPIYWWVIVCSILLTVVCISVVPVVTAPLSFLFIITIIIVIILLSTLHRCKHWGPEGLSSLRVPKLRVGAGIRSQICSDPLPLYCLRGWAGDSPGVEHAPAHRWQLKPRWAQLTQHVLESPHLHTKGVGLPSCVLTAWPCFLVQFAASQPSEKFPVGRGVFQSAAVGVPKTKPAPSRSPLLNMCGRNLVAACVWVKVTLNTHTHTQMGAALTHLRTLPGGVRTEVASGKVVTVWLGGQEVWMDESGRGGQAWDSRGGAVGSDGLAGRTGACKPRKIMSQKHLSR